MIGAKSGKRRQGVRKLIEDISSLPSDFHGAGSVSKKCLEAILSHCGENIAHSMETGAGRTTLLFSHLSKDHTVFSIDGKNSLSAAKECPLLNANNRIDFIEGPSQITLPKHEFQRKLNAVLLDGPHGYPFPDLEYYYLYRHIEKDGVLIVDDVQIPSIFNLYSYLREEDMFEFIEVVDGKMAFFRRTAVPALDPLGEIWNKQRYNINPVNVERVRAILKDSYVDVGTLMAKIKEKDQQFKEQSRLLAEKDRQIEALHNSLSWKVTGPLRAILGAIKG
jgi:hypothetical protein